MSDMGSTLTASALDSHMEREIGRLTDLLDRVKSLNEALDAIGVDTTPTVHEAQDLVQLETR